MNNKSSISKKIKSPEVNSVFKSYPQKIRSKLMFLRKLILEFEVANIQDKQWEKAPARTFNINSE